MNALIQHIKGDTAVKIAASIESAAAAEHVAAGERLPTVRGLAERLGVSPTTVASAYRMLKTRGVIVSQGRRGTRLSHRPIPPSRRVQPVHEWARNLYDGNPDPQMLAPLREALRRIKTTHHLYGDPPHDPELAGLLAAELRDEGVACGNLCIVNGAIDGIDRVLAEHLRTGDRVAVEDPGFTGVLDLLTSRGLSLVPVALDDEGMLPDQLAQAVESRAKALIVTPRAQSPTGAALSADRARALRRVLRSAPDLLIIEDDHANRVAGAPLEVLHDPRRNRWAHIHSLDKCLNPDLRMAAVTGDETTMAKVQDRFVVGERWVSHILQRLAHALLSDSGIRRRLARAQATYVLRRTALVEALRATGRRAQSRSGYNVWVPVVEETSTVQVLAAAGWAVSAGERFRLRSPPGIRITAATLKPPEARRLATDLCGAQTGRLATPHA